MFYWSPCYVSPPPKYVYRLKWNFLSDFTQYTHFYNYYINGKLLLAINWKILFSISPCVRGWILLMWFNINSILMFHFYGHFVHIKSRWQGKKFYYDKSRSILRTSSKLFAKTSHSDVSSKLFCQLMIYQLIIYVPHQFVENKEIKAIWLMSGFVIQILMSLLSISGNSAKKALPWHVKWL